MAGINFNDATTITSGFNVVNRSSGATPLLLEDFNTVHYYQQDNVPRSTGINITTQVVEDAIYDVIWVDASRTGANNDPKIYPNDATYSGQYQSYYIYSPGITFTSQSPNAFYFDHYGGGSGQNGCGRYICWTHRSNKKVLYQGGDDASVTIGWCVWRNTGTVWNTIGRLRDNADQADYHIWVRRMG